MQIPVFYIDKAGLCLIMGIIVGAFHYILTFFNPGNNRTGTTIFT
jgi:hypothetical protein